MIYRRIKFCFCQHFYDGNQRVPGVNRKTIEFIFIIFVNFDFVIAFTETKVSVYKIYKSV